MKSINILNKGTYTLALTVLLLSSCKLPKDIKAPDVPESFRFAEKTDNSIGDLPWKDFFKDAILRELIDSALVKNYDLQIALKNMASSGLLLKQTAWNNVPNLSLNVTGSSTNPSNNSLNGLSLGQFLGTNHIEDYSANLSLSWEADVWGKIRNQRKEVLAAYLQSAEARKAVQTSVISTLSKTYYNLLMLDEQLAIARRNVQLNDSTLNMIRLQFSAGQVTLLAVQQAQAQLENAEGLIPQFEQQIALHENALSILVGALPDKIARQRKPDDVDFPADLGSGLPSELVNRRPDVKNSELALVAANARVGISKAQMYPALRITATGGVNSFKASNWFNIPASLFGIAAASVAEPILNNRQLRTRYDIAKVERERAVLQFRQTVLNAVGEVSDALVKIDKIKEQEAIAARRVNTLSKATTNANQLFKSGMANYIEVITAQGQVLQSELELASLKAAQLNAITDLYRSLGGGWR